MDSVPQSASNRKKISGIPLQEVPFGQETSVMRDGVTKPFTSLTLPAETPLPALAPKSADIAPNASKAQPTKEIRLDILGPNQLALYQFMGFLLDRAGELDKIYEVKCRASNLEYTKKVAEYEKKLKEMRESGDFNSKIEMPPDNQLPEKNYEEMFEEYLLQHEVGLTEKFNITLFGRKFILQYRVYDKISTERIRSLPDGVIFLVEGQEEEFKKQFMECTELKQALFMHLFFGTQKVFFLDFFNYKDRLLKHRDYNEPHHQKVVSTLNSIFAFIGRRGLTQRNSSTGTAAEW